VRLPLVHGAVAQPSLGSGGGLRANPSIRASLTVGFGLAVTASSDPDSGGFRPGRCGLARALVAFFDLGDCWKRPDPRRRSWGWPGCGGVFRPGRWQRGPVRVLAAWSGLGGADGVRLAVVVRIWAGAFLAWSRSGVSTTL
jgi:hypothetical protein